MIAVGRYDSIEPGEAEVAFLVEDRHQGRGIGPLLLEHLAQAGRERGIDALRRRRAARQPAMITRLQGRRLRRRRAPSTTASCELEFRIDPTETAIGVMEQREHRAEARSIERLLPPAGRSRSSAPAVGRTPSAGRWCATSCSATSRAACTWSTRARTPVAGMPAYKTVGDIPGEVDLAVVAVPADAVQDVVARLRRQGRARPGRHLVGVRRDRRGGPAPPAAAGRAGPGLRPAAGRPQRPRRHQHRPRRVAQRLAVAAHAAPRPGRLLLPVRRARARRCWRRSTTAAWASRPSSPPATVPTSRATTCCSTGRRTTPPRSCCSTSSRSATRASSPASPAASAGASRSSRCGRAAAPRACPMGHAVRKIAAPAAGGGRDVPPGRRHPGRHAGRDVRRRPAARPPAAAPRSPGGGRRQLRRARPARGRRGQPASGSSVNKQVALGADAGAEDFEDALDAAIDDPEVDAVVAIFIPPLNTSGEDVANVLAAVGEQSDKPIVSTFLGAGACPSCCGSPTSPAPAPAAARCRRTPPSRTRCGRWPRVVEYAAWRAPPTGAPLPTEALVDRAAARRLVSELLMHHPEGKDLTTASSAAARGVRHRALGHPAGRDRSRRRSRRRTGSAHVVLKATADHLRHRPDLGDVWRNIDDAEEMRGRLGDAQRAHRLARTRAGFVVQKKAPPGVPVGVATIEDPLFGPVVSFGHRRGRHRAAGRPGVRRPAADRRRPRRDGPRGARRAAAARAPRRRARPTSPRWRTCSPRWPGWRRRARGGGPRAATRCSPRRTGASVLAATGRLSPPDRARRAWCASGAAGS